MIERFLIWNQEYNRSVMFLFFLLTFDNVKSIFNFGSSMKIYQAIDLSLSFIMHRHHLRYSSRDLDGHAASKLNFSPGWWKKKKKKKRYPSFRLM